MRIYLGYLVRGEFYDYYDNLLREISSRFNLENLLKKSRIPQAPGVLEENGKIS